MLVLLLAAAAVARPYFGVDWVPAGRSDLAWYDAGQQTGLLVGEHDGLLQPPLTPWFGVARGRDAWLGGLSLVQLSTRDSDGSGTSLEYLGALRPSLDWRHVVGQPQAGKVAAYLQGGLYGVVPSARLHSDAYTSEEQAAADADSRAARARIAGVGARGGGGAEIALGSGLTLGARYLVVVHRGTDLDANAYTVSWFTRGEAALVLGFLL